MNPCHGLDACGGARQSTAFAGGGGSQTKADWMVASPSNKCGDDCAASCVSGVTDGESRETNGHSVDQKRGWLFAPEGSDNGTELQEAMVSSSSRTPILADLPSPFTEGVRNKSAAACISSISSNDGSRLNAYRAIVEECWKSSDPFDISSFHSLMWDTGLTTDSDKGRWVGQGIDFRSCKKQFASCGSGDESSILSVLAADHGPWGLTQSHGGPCGVLAAIQAELLRILLFGGRNPLDYPHVEIGSVPVQASAYLSDELTREALAMSIAIILARSAVLPSAAAASGEEETSERCGGVSVVLPSRPSVSASLSWDDLEPWSTPSAGKVKSHTLRTYTIALKDSLAPIGGPQKGPHKRQKVNGTLESKEEKILRLARATAAFLQDSGPPGGSSPLDSFRRPGGVMLMVMSLVASRGPEVIHDEMDDPMGTNLTSQFGHCSQELINLLLTGHAVSNVFDNTLTPSGELTCRGIQYRPEVGYLSQLESLRYCEVGNFYKRPWSSVWVVGSTSHFTVLFGDPGCLEETESDLLLEKCRRAFKSVEGGEENGFISSNNLVAVLESLGVHLGGKNQESTLSAALEVSDAGIILWDDFWKATSRLMTGATIDQVLDETTCSGGTDRHPCNSPSNFAENHPDEKLARRVHRMSQGDTEDGFPQRNWERDSTNTSLSATPVSAEPGATAVLYPINLESLSDEELARKLQAEWDAEVSGLTTNVVALSKSKGSLQLNNVDTRGSIAASELAREGNFEHSTQQGTCEKNHHSLSFEKYGNSFRLYHYNGLRGGKLTEFRVTRLTAEEAVGASIALNRGNSHPGGSGDLEDVLRTKWPSCMINWLGKTPPYID